VRARARRPRGRPVPAGNKWLLTAPLCAGRHLKQWKKRWCVLQDNILYCFKQERVYDNPTEIIDLKVYNSVKSSEDSTGRDCSFDVSSREHGFSLVAETDAIKEGTLVAAGSPWLPSARGLTRRWLTRAVADWIRAIGRAIVMSRNRKDDWQEDQPE
jgi:hypothetical protein